MHITKVSISRIMLRDRGSASDISIEGDILIQPDDPNSDPIRQHMPENIRVDQLPQGTQDLISELFAACQVRLEHKHPVVKEE